jgi:hypothetical protein
MARWVATPPHGTPSTSCWQVRTTWATDPSFPPAAATAAAASRRTATSPTGAVRAVSAMRSQRPVPRPNPASHTACPRWSPRRSTARAVLRRRSPLQPWPLGRLRRPSWWLHGFPGRVSEVTGRVGPASLARGQRSHNRRVPDHQNHAKDHVPHRRHRPASAIRRVGPRPSGSRRAPLTRSPPNTRPFQLRGRTGCRSEGAAEPEEAPGMALRFLRCDPCPHRTMGTRTPAGGTGSSQADVSASGSAVERQAGSLAHRVSRG